MFVGVSTTDHHPTAATLKNENLIIMSTPTTVPSAKPLWVLPSSFSLQILKSVISSSHRCPTRDFSDGGVPAVYINYIERFELSVLILPQVNPVKKKLREILKGLRSLEKFEYELAQSYGMVVRGRIDSEEILEETRARALSGSDSQSEQDLQTLRELESCRKRKAETLRPSVLGWRAPNDTVSARSSDELT